MNLTLQDLNTDENFYKSIKKYINQRHMDLYEKLFHFIIFLFLFIPVMILYHVHFYDSFDFILRRICIFTIVIINIYCIIKYTIVLLKLSRYPDTLDGLRDKAFLLKESEVTEFLDNYFIFHEIKNNYRKEDIIIKLLEFNGNNNCLYFYCYNKKRDLLFKQRLKNVFTEESKKIKNDIFVNLWKGKIHVIYNPESVTPLSYVNWQAKLKKET